MRQCCARRNLYGMHSILHRHSLIAQSMTQHGGSVLCDARRTVQLLPDRIQLIVGQSEMLTLTELPQLCRNLTLIKQSRTRGQGQNAVRVQKYFSPSAKLGETGLVHCDEYWLFNHIFMLCHGIRRRPRLSTFTHLQQLKFDFYY